MIYLIISIVFMAGLVVALRLGTSRGADPIGINAGFRISAGLVMLVWALLTFDEATWVEGWDAAGWLAIVAATCFWLSGQSSIHAIGLGHLGITWTVVRCSMILPTAASIFYWREVELTPELPLLVRGMGALVVLLALVMIGIDRALAARGRLVEDGQRRLRLWVFWLASAFLFQGGWEITLRATRTLDSHESRMFFITVVFVGAMLLSLPLLLTGRRFGRLEIGFGCLAGVCSLLGSGTRVWALRELDGVIVFPVTTISVTLLVQAAGRTIWSEKMGPWGFAGLGAAIAGIVLLAVRV